MCICLLNCNTGERTSTKLPSCLYSPRSPLGLYLHMTNVGSGGHGSQEFGPLSQSRRRETGDGPSRRQSTPEAGLAPSACVAETETALHAAMPQEVLTS